MSIAASPALVSAAVTLVATAGAGGAVGAVLPGLLGGVAAAVVAGALVHVLGTTAPVAPAEDGRLGEAVAANSQLRHDLRGALSPALLVSDRLTGHADPAVAKAGNIVVRAVERATALLETNKHDDAGRLAPAGERAKG